MWGTLMMGALFSALNPVRLAVVALLISRPRPVQSLFAYWVGALAAGIPSLLIPLMVLHSSEKVSSFTQHLATSPTFRHIQVGMGLLALSIAALMIVRPSARQQAPASGGRNGTPARAGTTSTLELDPNTPPAISRLLGRNRDSVIGGGSPIRQLLGRVGNAWDNGSVWVAGLLGVVMGGPSVDGAVLGIALIVTSGATLGTQVSAAIAFVFGILLIVELILVSSVVAPAKTREALRVVHDWVQAHRRKILITLFAIVGAALVAQGLGAI
jgi:hypothetical protein